jgi:hypothetical protein
VIVADRPRIAFLKWGEIPADHPPPLRSGQTGFYLVNDGAAAYEVTVQRFEIEPSVTARSETLARIGPGESAFVLVWLEGYSGLAIATEKWDLVGALARADVHSGGGRGTYGGPDFALTVTVAYRDADELLRFRSSARLTFIRSQSRISFGPTSHSEYGPTRESVSEAPERRESGGGRRPEARNTEAPGEQFEHTPSARVEGGVSLETSPGLRRRPTQSALQKSKLRKARSSWLDEQISTRGWTSDVDVQNNGGPTYNTIQRYRTGTKSTRDPYVRGKLSHAFGCDIKQVPE